MEATKVDNSEPAKVVPAAAAVAPAALDPQTQAKYKFWRYRVFIGLLVGYTASYFTRGCFTYVSPLLRRDAGLSLGDIGLINSVFAISQGISKFSSGIIADRVDARYFLAAGLIIASVLDMTLCFSTNVWWMTANIALIGWFSQFVVPACAKIISYWFAQSERGTWWSAWNMGANLGGFLVAIVSGFCAAQFGWRWGMFIPGAIGIACGLFALVMVKADPAMLGFPAPEAFLGEAVVEKPKPAAGKADEPAETKDEIVMKYVLKNPYVWVLGISWALVYFVRQGVSSWSHFYLMDVKGVVSASDAAARVSGRELGGLAGNLFSGYASTKYFDGKRIPVIVLYTVGLIGSLFALWGLPGGNAVLDYITISILGFFIYGPQNLVGLAATEFAHKSAASSAIGLVGLLSYVGATFSGSPITYLVKKFGWNSFFISMIGCCVLIIALVLPLWNKKTYADTLPKPKEGAADKS